MSRKRVERRLAAILAADVVGYSRLMGADEAGTLGRLKALRRELLDPKTAEHGGRVVKLMGDGALVEFASVVDAVQCAVEIQRGMAERNAGISADERIRFRIGINLGDVIIEDDDIYGDGVNLAARLEALAEPGGICVSRTVIDHVKGKVVLAIDDLGERRVKNIAAPVGVYRVRVGEDVSEAMTPGPPAVEPSARPSIAVLPFTNMSHDPEQEYFSDGMTEDLITDLSKISGLLVIARHSSFAYKGRAASVRQIAAELGVRYVVEGSVRRAGKRIRINAQLIEAATDAHLWAERYDRDVEDIFAVQDEVVAEIVEVLKLTLGQIDLGGSDRPASLEAHECLMRGRDLCHGYIAQDNAKAKEWLEKAAQLDPNYAQAHLWLAFCHWLDWHCGWSRSESNSLELAAHEASRAVDLDPREPLARAILGLTHLYKRELTKSIREYKEALRLQPNQPDVLVFLSELLMMDGRPLEGIKCIERAIRLNPHHPDIYRWELAFGQYAARRYEDAAESIRRMASPGAARRILAASLAQLGRIKEARVEAEGFLQDNPEFSARAWGRMLPFRQDADRQHFIDGYLKAGLPA